MERQSPSGQLDRRSRAVNHAYPNPSDVFFSDSGGTVIIDNHFGQVGVTDMRFKTMYVLVADSIELAAPEVVVDLATSQVTIGSALIGTAGLTLTGAGDFFSVVPTPMLARHLLKMVS